jgi:hypothetical protein
VITKAEEINPEIVTSEKLKDEEPKETIEEDKDEETLAS